MRAMPSCDLGGVAGEFLAEGDGRGVLQMGAADLHDIRECLRLVGQRRQEMAQSGHSRSLISRAAAMCMAVGNDVVRRLAAVHVVVRVNGDLPPRSPPRRSLARFARTSFMFMLDWVPEPVCHTTSGNSSSYLPCDDLGGGLGNRIGHARLQRAEILVHEGGGLLDEGERVDERERHPLAADAEILKRTLRLRAPAICRRGPRSGRTYRIRCGC